MKKKVFLLVFFCLIFAGLFADWHFRLLFFKSPYASIPVQFTTDHIPYTEIEIEGQKYFMEIDLGFDGEFSLQNHILEKIPKIPKSDAFFFDFKGNDYVSPRYNIGEIKMGKVRIGTPSVMQESNKFLENVQTGKSERQPSEIAGRMGNKFLLKLNLLLDFKKGLFFFIRPQKGLEPLRKKRYKIENLLEVPLETSSCYAIFTIETDVGEKRFLLDTGSTLSRIKPFFVTPEDLKKMRENTNSRMYITSSKFVIGTHNFGEQDLYLIELADKWEGIDGILGMDFLMNHIVYLDLRARKAWIGP